MIANSADLNRLAEDIALIAIGFIAIVNDDPAAHIDRMFRAVDAQ